MHSFLSFHAFTFTFQTYIFSILVIGEPKFAGVLGLTWDHKPSCLCIPSMDQTSIICRGLNSKGVRLQWAECGVLVYTHEDSQ